MIKQGPIFLIIAVILFHAPSWGSKVESLRMARSTIRAGETLHTLLKKNGFNEEDVKNIWRQNPLPKNFRILADEPYLVINDQKEKTRGIKFFEQLSDYSYYLFKSGDGEVTGKRILEKYRTEIITLKGKVLGGILNSILSIVNNDWVAFRFLDAYLFDINPRKDLSRGASFSMKLEKKFLGDQFVKYGEVLETNLEVKGQVETRKFIPLGNGGVFLDPTTPAFAEAKDLYAPVNYIHISSVFSNHRVHPIRGKSKPHNGVDFELPVGSEVFSAHKGTIEKIGKDRAAGNHVIIRHLNGYTTAYLHLNSIQSNLRVGKHVGIGELIGQVGCTGYCTSPHLHFSVKKGKRPIDPMKVMRRYPYQFAQQIVSSVNKL